LPEPEGGEYRVEWPEIMVLTEEDRAKIGEKKANALAKYASAPGADMVMPPDVFLKEIMELDDDQITAIMEELAGQLKEEEEVLEE